MLVGNQIDPEQFLLWHYTKTGKLAPYFGLLVILTLTSH